MPPGKKTKNTLACVFIVANVLGMCHWYHCSLLIYRFLKLLQGATAVEFFEQSDTIGVSPKKGAFCHNKQTFLLNLQKADIREYLYHE